MGGRAARPLPRLVRPPRGDRAPGAAAAVHVKEPLMKTSRILAAAAAALAIAVAVPIFAQSEADDHKAKLEDIHKLLDLNGGAGAAKDAMTQMSGSMAKAMPQVPQEFWDEFMKEVNAQELIDLSVPVYDKYLTHGDVKELIQFYETPAGKKLASVQ